MGLLSVNFWHILEQCWQCFWAVALEVYVRGELLHIMLPKIHYWKVSTSIWGVHYIVHSPSQYGGREGEGFTRAVMSRFLECSSRGSKFVKKCRFHRIYYLQSSQSHNALNNSKVLAIFYKWALLQFFLMVGATLMGALISMKLEPLVMVQHNSNNAFYVMKSSFWMELVAAHPLYRTRDLDPFSS